MNALQKMYLKLAIATLNKDSKFYAEDVATFRRFSFQKNSAQLKESISRFKAINATTVAECNFHCVTEGLFNW